MAKQFKGQEIQYPVNEKLMEHFSNCLTLLMLDFQKSSPDEKIPAGYIPVERIDDVLRNLGFDYIVDLEKQKLNTELLY